MNTSLYRKYRPSSFSAIIGQNLIRTILINSLKSNRISHAYIFSGPHGIGKTSISRIFAKSINCLEPKDGDCCNKCKNCQVINDSSTSDVIELDAASNNGVNDVREMINNINYLPQHLAKKVYIIDEAHMLSNSAWNALLKTIEDPPKHIIFIFATTELAKIPLTIISRCQKFDFHRIPSQEIQRQLEQICSFEKYQISNEAIQTLANIANGSLRDSLSMLDQLINCSGNNKITIEDIENLFALTSVDAKIEIIDNIIKQNLLRLMEIFNELEKRGANFFNLCKEILEIIIDKIIYQKTASIKNLKTLRQINVDSFSIKEEILYKMVEILQNALNEIRINFDERFFFEIAIWKCIALFDKKIDQKTNIEKIVNHEAKQEPKIEKSEEKPEVLIEQVDDFKTMENIVSLDKILNVVKIEKPVKKDKFYKTRVLKFENQKIENLIETSNIEIEQLFYQIAYNQKKEITNEVKSIFEKQKSEMILSPIEGFFKSANKVWIASTNGMVLIFNDDLTAENFNQIAQSIEFLSYIKEKFNKIYCVIGVSKKQALLFSTNFKKARWEKTFDDCDLKQFEELLKTEKTVKEIALDFFKDELQGE